MSDQHNSTILPPERNEKAFNRMQTIKRNFFAMRNGALADQMRQGGVNYRINFGLNLPQIKDIASEILSEGLAPDELADLASALWDNVNTRESRLLAPIIFPAGKMTQALAHQWMAEAQTTEVADILCHSLLRHLPFASEIAMETLDDADANEMQRYTAMRLLLNLLAGGKADATAIREKIAALPCEASATLSRLKRICLCRVD